MTNIADSTGRARAAGPQLPTLADLNRATAHTAATLADPAATVQDASRAAELEAATLHAFWHRPGPQAKAALETEPEAAA
jgi:hypothetical protein